MIINKKYLFYVICTFIAAVAIALTAILLLPEKDDDYKTSGTDTVAFVNGFPIEDKELLLMIQLTANSQGKKESDETIKARALEKLVRVKAAQQLAIRYGILNDISYSSFIEELNNENERRAKALESNEIIYGPLCNIKQ